MQQPWEFQFFFPIGQSSCFHWKSPRNILSNLKYVSITVFHFMNFPHIWYKDSYRLPGIHLFILLFFYLAFSQEDYLSAIERVVPVTIWLGLASLSVEILKALKRYLVLFRCKCLYLLLYCIQLYCHLAECSHIYPAHPVSLKHSSNQNFWLN